MIKKKLLMLAAILICGGIVMPVVQAVEGDVLFSLSGRGTVTITDQAETIFTPSATGNVCYQLPGSEAWAAQMLEKIRHANKQR